MTALTVQDGWVDSYRHLRPEGQDYTWWSQRGAARAKNVGWRIDYVMASASLRPHLKRAWIEPQVMGSDHCPVGVELKF